MSFYFKYFSRSPLVFIYCFLLFLITIHSSLFAYYDKDNEYEITFFHQGMNCCECFLHCSCFGQCIGKYSVCFPDDKPYHPRNSIDKAWHEFMKGILSAKKVGPFFTIDWHSLQRLVHYQKEQNIHSIRDYLDIIEEFKNFIKEARSKSIKLYQELYSLPQEQNKLEENLRRIEQEYQNASQILDEIPSQLIPLYQETIRNCSHLSLFATYNQGLIHSLLGNWDEAVLEIINFMDLAEKNKIKCLDSKIYQICGETYLEINLFHEAINALTKAINKNPENKQAYFYRASAYFENGNFDQAIQDYLMSDKETPILSIHKSPQDFRTAFINSLCQNASDASIEFIPSFCSSMYGLGTAIWATHPLNPLALENISSFADTCYIASECVVECFKNIDQNTLNECIEQVKILYERFDQLSETEKGELIGYAIGRYGVDILAGSLTSSIPVAIVNGSKLLVKASEAFRNLRNTNRACTLETMAMSHANKEKLVSSGLKHAVARENYFKNVNYNFDAHNKHILGHNDYDGVRSVWVHPNPEGILRKFGGKGHPERGFPGQPGYKETIDFGEYIGLWKNEEGTMSLPTTRGTIHYSKKGAHIVPVHPNPKYKKLEK